MSCSTSTRKLNPDVLFSRSIRVNVYDSSLCLGLANVSCRRSGSEAYVAGNTEKRGHVRQIRTTPTHTSLDSYVDEDRSSSYRRGVTT